MNRRAARSLAPIRLLIVAFVFVTLVVAGGSTAAAASPDPGPEPSPPVTANEFLPEDRDLSDCVGLVERPGCGSEERGGALLNVVFVIVIAGMAFIFWRISIGVRQNRAELARTELARTERAREDQERDARELDARERDAQEPTETIDP